MDSFWYLKMTSLDHVVLVTMWMQMLTPKVPRTEFLCLKSFVDVSNQVSNRSNLHHYSLHFSHVSKWETRQQTQNIATNFMG